MATINIDIQPDAALAILVDAICFNHNYEETHPPGQTRGQFSKALIAQWCKAEVKEYRRAIAVQEAAANAVAAAEAEITIT